MNANALRALSRAELQKLARVRQLCFALARRH